MVGYETSDGWKGGNWLGGQNAWMTRHDGYPLLFSSCHTLFFLCLLTFSTHGLFERVEPLEEFGLATMEMHQGNMAFIFFFDFLLFFFFFFFFFFSIHPLFFPFFFLLFFFLFLH